MVDKAEWYQLNIVSIYGKRFLPWTLLSVLVALTLPLHGTLAEDSLAEPYIWVAPASDTSNNHGPQDSSTATSLPEGTAPDWIHVFDGANDSSYFARQQFLIVPPRKEEALSFESEDTFTDPRALAVTLFFREIEGGFLRVLFGNWPAEILLSANLYEGINMPNQRTLLIPESMLDQPKRLTVEAGSSRSGLKKIFFRWVHTKMVSVSPSQGQTTKPVLIDETQRIIKEGEAFGTGEPPVEDSAKGNLVVANLTSKPERIEDGVAFVFDLEESPKVVRVEAEFSGLPLESNRNHTSFWLNNEPIGIIPTETPTLKDAGYEGLQAGAPVYTGWRKASALIPVDKLFRGENHLLFSWVDDSDNPKPVAIRNLKLELIFPEKESLPFIIEEEGLELPSVTSPVAPTTGEGRYQLTVPPIETENLIPLTPIPVE